MDFNNKKLADSPELTANPISRALVLWIFPFLKNGAKKDLTLEDVYHLLPEDSSEELDRKMYRSWCREQDLAIILKRRPKLWRAIWKLIWLPNLFIGIGYLFNDIVLKTLQPISLRLFIKTFQSESTVANTQSLPRDQFVYATILVLTNFLQTIIFQHIHREAFHIAMKMRLGVSSLIYRKTLKVGKTDGEQGNVGKLTNLLSSDINRFNEVFHLLHFLYISPIQLCIYTYLLWNELGPATLAGVGCMLLVLPMQTYTGRYFMRFRTNIAKRTDERGRFLNEIVRGIQLIKMYTWEKPFSKVVSGLRRAEIKFIRKSLYLKGLMTAVHTISSELIPFCSLVAYASLGNSMDADKVFFSLTIFSTLQLLIMHRVPQASSQVGELIASLTRIEDFLLSGETSETLLKDEEKGTESHGNAALQVNGLPKIVLQNFSAGWTKETNILKNLTLNLEGNKLVLVVGHVGCGKSSFLNAILDELSTAASSPSKNGVSCCHHEGRLCYASQEPWIFPGSIRQNVLFGLEMEEERYWKVLEACNLMEDLNRLPHGDLTLVGERGILLSGGQKARVNLARAVYQEGDIYLLDDCLSALDPNVGHKLFNECIKGFLHGSLRILVTHQLQYLPMADYVIVMTKDGQIWAQGAYKDLKQSGIDFTSLMTQEYLEEPEAPTVKSMEDKRDGMNGKEKKALDGKEEKVEEEKKAVGAVGLEMYYKYFKYGGSHLMIALLVGGFLASQLLKNISEYWVSKWTNEAINSTSSITTTTRTKVFNSSDQDLYVYVYCAFMAVYTIVAVFRSIIYFRHCMKISVNLHDKMFQSLVRAPIKFFNDNPSGRVMNRFTKDLNQIDEQLSVAFFDFITIVLSLLGVIAINVYANYYVAIPSCVYFYGLWKMRNFYLKSARDLKRIESLTKSPLFTHVSMTIQGVSTIRALNAQSRMVHQFNVIQDRHTSVGYMIFNTVRWFRQWLQLISVAYLAIVTFGFLILSTSSQAGNVGLAISAILAITGTGLLQYGIRQSAETENLMTSVERVLEYVNVEPEASMDRDEDKKLPENWPSQGSMSFDRVTLAYNDTNTVLKEVTFSVKSKQKVGIVGRTGAGKSSLIAALFRLKELCSGYIAIDGIKIDTLGLKTLRSAISIIPQDPVLFTGSLRYNVDPFNQFSDDQIWESLREVELQSAIDHLEFAVSDGGGNLSVGQRQLVCLARALLRRNKILVLDEATANIDPVTDELVQRTIRRKFSDCTILTIAHRIQTILDSDVIIVMENGRVVEFGDTQNLLANPEGRFFAMVNQL